MAPPNTYLKLNKNSADCTIPMTLRPGVRMYFRSARTATCRASEVAPGGLAGRVITWVIVIACSVR